MQTPSFSRLGTRPKYTIMKQLSVKNGRLTLFFQGFI